MIIGHIGARKGSKGVPGKNFRMICGKPLIDWSLDQLFASSRVDAVVVSTDDEAIYDHAVAKGALKILGLAALAACLLEPMWTGELTLTLKGNGTIEEPSPKIARDE